MLPLAVVGLTQPALLWRGVVVLSWCRVSWNHAYGHAGGSQIDNARVGHDTHTHTGFGGEGGVDVTHNSFGNGRSNGLTFVQLPAESYCQMPEAERFEKNTKNEPQTQKSM